MPSSQGKTAIQLSRTAGGRRLPDLNYRRSLALARHASDREGVLSEACPGLPTTSSLDASVAAPAIVVSIDAPSEGASVASHTPARGNDIAIKNARQKARTKSARTARPQVRRTEMR